MKKFYALFAAALMSVSMFAQAPTQAELQSYMQTGYYVACFSTPTQGTCNDIVWIGTYNDWNADDPDKIVCQELPNHPGWYVAVVPVAAEGGENSGKPVQLNECGKFDWANQCGAYGTIELVAGEVTIASGQEGKETDLKDWSTTQPTIITMSAWKASPCNNVCNEHAYTLYLFDPYCEAHPEFAPYLRGNFNNWGNAVPMALKDTMIGGEEVSIWVYTTEPISGVMQFKWNNSSDKDNWDNQFQYFIPADEDNDIPAKWENFADFYSNKLDTIPDVTVIDDYTFMFDFSDDTKYRYGQCSAEPADTTKYLTIVGVNVPVAGAPETVEIIGDFDGWTGKAMTWNPSTGWFGAYDIMAKENDKFKFRAPGTWDNQLMVYIPANADAEGKWVNMDNLTFKDHWRDDTYKGNPCKWVELDFSDTSKYCWTAAQGIENIVLTEQAQKVVVDGVMYIIRDNKMFNVQGTQVR